MKVYRDEVLLKRIGNKIKELRKQKKYSQREFAEISEVPIAQIKRIETGSINASVCALNAIAKAFDIELKELFDFSGS